MNYFFFLLHSYMEQTQLFILLGIAIIVILVGYFFLFNKENFDPDYQTNLETYIRSKISNQGVLSNGVVQKYKIEGKYNYNLYFNLPTINSSFQTKDLDKPFNAPIPTVDYEVYGSLDGGTYKYLGNLNRAGNGEYSFEFSSEENYINVQVRIGNTLVSSVKI